MWINSAFPRKSFYYSADGTHAGGEAKRPKPAEGAPNTEALFKAPDSPDQKLTETITVFEMLSRYMRYPGQDGADDWGEFVLKQAEDFAADVKRLIEKGANPNLKIKGISLLTKLSLIYSDLNLSALHGNELLYSTFKELLLSLVKSGANLPNKIYLTEDRSYSPALEIFKLDDLEELLSIELDEPTLTTLLNQFVRSYCSISGDIFPGGPPAYNAKFLEIVNAMIAKGANPYARNADDNSAQDLAIEIDCHDSIKKALGLEIEDARLSLVELYAEGKIDELVSRNRSAEDFITSDGLAVDSVVYKMAQAGDIDTLRRFLGPININFKANPEFWSKVLKAPLARLGSDGDKHEQTAMFFLNKGVNPDYIDDSSVFRSPSEQVRIGFVKSPGIIQRIRELSSYIENKNLQDLHKLLDQISEADLNFGELNDLFNSGVMQQLRIAYNEYILDPNNYGKLEAFKSKIPKID